MRSKKNTIGNKEAIDTVSIIHFDWILNETGKEFADWKFYDDRVYDAVFNQGPENSGRIYSALPAGNQFPSL